MTTAGIAIINGRYFYLHTDAHRMGPYYREIFKTNPKSVNEFVHRLITIHSFNIEEVSRDRGMEIANTFAETIWTVDVHKKKYRAMSGLVQEGDPQNLFAPPPPYRFGARKPRKQPPKQRAARKKKPRRKS